MINTKIKALISGFLFSVIISFTGFSTRCDGISQKILRLHIIANSDSREDQALKIKVRDTILNTFGENLKNTKTLEESQAYLKENINEIILKAQEEINKNGFKYLAKAEIVNMYFGIRNYGQTTLPSGFYNALRITIGKAEGKNWWCVMFPPMCLPAAEERQELCGVLTQSELDLTLCEPESEYIFKFKLLEIFMEFKNFLKSTFCFEYTKDLFYLTKQSICENFEIKFKIQEIFSNDIFFE